MQLRESLPLPVEVMHRRVLAIRRRVRERSVAKIHAVPTIASERGGQERRMHVPERNAVGRTEAAVDGHAHDGGACSAHVKRKANDVPLRPLAAETVITGSIVPLLQPDAVHSPRKSVIASAFALVILPRFELRRTKAELHGSDEVDDVKLKIKAAPAQPDVGNKRVEALQLQLVVGCDAAAASVAIDHNAARRAMEFNDSGVFGFSACTQLSFLSCDLRSGFFDDVYNVGVSL
jgi:hypothetical protein